MSRATVRVSLVALLLTGSLTNVSPAQTTAMNPLAGAKGLRWKPGIAQRDVLVTKAPYAGVTDRRSTRAERARAERRVAGRVYDLGARVATIDVTPYKKVWKSLHEKATWNPCRRHEPGRGTAPDDCHKAIVRWKAKQHEEIARFVKNVVMSPTPDRGVGPDFRFLLHSRVNGRRAFIRDMVRAIRHAQKANVGDRLAGVMIGEHEEEHAYTRHGGGYLPLGFRIARGINQGLGYKWLKSRDRALTLNGGRFGPDFNRIARGIDAYDFFTRIGRQTQFFGFTFKYYLGDRPRLTYDLPGSDTNRTWEEFLKEPDTAASTDVDGLGLANLQRRLAASDVPPRLNEVLFIGDSADSLYAVKTKARRNASGEIVEQWWTRKGCDQVRAIRRVFAEYGWNSFLFGQPLDYRDKIGDELRRGMWSHGFDPQHPLTWWREWADPSSGEGEEHFQPCSGTTG